MPPAKLHPRVDSTRDTAHLLPPFTKGGLRGGSSFHVKRSIEFF